MAVRRVPVTPLDAGAWKSLFDIRSQRIRILGFVGRVANLDFHAMASII